MPADYPYTIELNRGIRPRARQRMDKQGGWLETCLNLRPSEEGLHAPQTSYDGTVITAPSAWPWPQYRKDQGLLYLCDETGISSVAEPAMIPTAITTYDAANPVNVKAILSGGHWQIASIQDMLFLTNGASVVFWLPSNDGDKYLVVDAGMNALCSANGRMFFGGLNVADHWTGRPANWDELFSVWQKTVPAHVAAHTRQADPGLNWIFWANYTGAVYDWPLVAIPAILGYLPDVDLQDIMGALKAMIEAGDIGLLPLKAEGAVKRIAALGDDLVVYSDQAIHVLRADEGHYRPRKVFDAGVPAPNLVCIGRDEHLFISPDAVLWSMSTERGLERLGYSDTLGAIDDLTDVAMVYDPSIGEYYISDGVIQCVYGSNGLNLLSDTFCSFYRKKDSDIVAYGVDSAVVAFDVKTSLMDLGASGIKDVGFVEVHGTGITDLTIGAEYRYDQAGALAIFPQVPAGPEGVAYLGLSGTEMAFRVQGTLSSSSGKVEKIVARVRHSEARHVRGPRPQYA